MAIPSCSKCGHEFFGGSSIEPNGLSYRVNVIFCLKCGTIAGVLDRIDIGSIIQDMEEKLEDMEHKIDYLIK